MPIMHFAANALVGESMTNPSKYFRNNVAAGINLLDAAVEAGVKKFIFSSTCATYGMPEKVPMDERLPQKPINPYGQSKLMFEQVLHWYDKIHGLVMSTSAISTPRARASSSARTTASRRTSSRTSSRSRWARRRRSRFTARNTPRPTAPASAISSTSSDLAAAHMLALGRETSASYNLGTGEGFSVRQVIDVARKVTGHPIPVRGQGSAPRRSAPAGRQLAQDHQRTRLAPEVHRASSPSSKAPGPGTRSTRTGTGIEGRSEKVEGRSKNPEHPPFYFLPSNFFLP